MFGIGVHTLLRRRKEYGMPVARDCYSGFTDDQHDEAIKRTLQDHPNSGKQMSTVMRIYLMTRLLCGKVPEFKDGHTISLEQMLMTTFRWSQVA